MEVVATDFDSAAAEVKDLLDCADEFHRAHHSRYLALNKSAFVMLMSKFEAHCETVVGDVVAECLKRCRPADQLPDSIRHAAFQQLVARLIRDGRPLDSREKLRQHIDILVTFCQAGKIPAEFIVPAEFSYGKHGSTQLAKLLAIVGCDDMVANFKWPARSPDGLLANTSDAEFRSEFDSMTNIRNNILHGDASPPLTPAETRWRLSMLSAFAVELDARLAQIA